jgi:predicted SprT family Zn-dependent metalloprotease
LDRTLEKPTQEYSCFQQAFEYFNGELFERTLPHCLITYQRLRTYGGYYSHKIFHARGDEAETDEIALNPQKFAAQSDAEILAILVHEMAHQWQFHFGKPSGRYHNRQWADRMDALGLTPSSTGKPGGNRTGYRMSHYTLAGGPFDTAVKDLLGGGFVLTWQSKGRDSKARKLDRNKHTYRCPSCRLTAWAKPDAPLICGACEVALVDQERAKAPAPLPPGAAT